MYNLELTNMSDHVHSTRLLKSPGLVRRALGTGRPGQFLGPVPIRTPLNPDAPVGARREEKVSLIVRHTYVTHRQQNDFTRS